MLDKPIRTEGEPSYGVTLHYSADKTKVSARSHIPYVWVNSGQFHIDRSTYTEATPVADELIEYFGAMSATVQHIDQTIADLTAKRDTLLTHMDQCMTNGKVVDFGS